MADMSEKRVTDNVGKTKALLLTFIMLSSLFAGGVVLIGSDNNNVDGATYGEESLKFLELNSIEMTCKVTGPKDDLTLNGDLAIPGNVTISGNSYTVVEIGNDAFKNGTGLISVTIPDSVKVIGNSAFYNCTSIISVTIPNSVEKIGHSAFYNCRNLTSVTLPDGLETIDTYSFCQTGLTSITIPDSVKNINAIAFQACNKLEMITIPSAVTFISESAFSNCQNLMAINVADNNEHFSSVAGVLFDIDKKTLLTCPRGLTGKYIIPDGTENIGKMAFCYGQLTSVTIPNSVKSIGDNAFYYGNYLTSVTIPDSVENIGSYAFSRCTYLKALAIPDTISSEVVDYEGVLIRYSGTNVATATMNDDGTVNVFLSDGKKINTANAGTTKDGKNISVSISSGIAKLTVGDNKIVYLNVVSSGGTEPNQQGSGPDGSGPDEPGSSSDNTMLYVGIAAAVAVAALALVYFLFIRKV